jgi:hypothetical protein
MVTAHIIRDIVCSKSAEDNLLASYTLANPLNHYFREPS